jgi:solute carrier family 35 protein C2
MAQLATTSSRDRANIYPPTPKDPDGAEDRDAAIQKRMDDFEGWNEDWSEGDDEREEEEDEIIKHRRERIGDGRPDGSWGTWWDRNM